MAPMPSPTARPEEKKRDDALSQTCKTNHTDSEKNKAADVDFYEQHQRLRSEVRGQRRLKRKKKGTVRL